MTFRPPGGGGVTLLLRGGSGGGQRCCPTLTGRRRLTPPNATYLTRLWLMGWSGLSNDRKVGDSNPAPSQSAVESLGKTLNSQLPRTNVSGCWVEVGGADSVRLSQGSYGYTCSLPPLACMNNRFKVKSFGSLKSAI